MDMDYLHSTVEFVDDPESKFIAYCDSDCAEEIEFIPYNGAAEPQSGDLGDLVIWFDEGYVYKLKQEDGMYDAFQRQPGYVYRDIEFAVFTEIVSDEESIGAAANFLVIQPLKDQVEEILWRDYE